MTGKSYYLTTLGDWRRHMAKFAHSHYVVLDSSPGEAAQEPSEALRILVLVEADEGAHNALEDDPTFEALPHPLQQKPLPEAARAALSGKGIGAGASTFDVAEMIGRVHPLLRFRVF